MGKTAATREEKEAGVSDGWLVIRVGEYGRWLAVAADGLRQQETEEEQRAASLSAIAERWSRGCGWTDRTVGGKRPEQQGRVGGLRQRVEVVVAGEAATEAALEEKGR
ncbi:hypothetical protein BHM03_00055653, partial [Ensete ventricosum]